MPAEWAPRAPSSQAATLLNNNASVITDLAKLGKPGTRYTHDFFVPGTLIAFPSVAVTDAREDPRRDLSGRRALPAGAARERHGAEDHRHREDRRPDDPDHRQAADATPAQTATERHLHPGRAAEAVRQVQRVRRWRWRWRRRRLMAAVGPAQRERSGSGPATFGGFASNPAFQKCLTPAQISYEQNVIVPSRPSLGSSTRRRPTPPPRATPSPASTRPTHDRPHHQGAARLGHLVHQQNRHEVLVEHRLRQHRRSLKAGGTITINAKSYKIVGLVDTDAHRERLGHLLPALHDAEPGLAPRYVNEVLVAVKSSSEVAAVTNAIKAELPGATVLTSKSLADQVTGSLSNAHKLANDLGGALAIVVLLAAFLIAGLLTLSSVSKRVREIGSLRAIGSSRAAPSSARSWPRRSASASSAG